MRFFSVFFTGNGSKLTSFFSMDFLLLFLPLTILLYALMPKKAKKYLLLFMSFVFFALISGWLLIYLVVSVLSMLGFGVWMEKIHKQRKAALKEAAKEEKKAIKSRFQKKSQRVLALAVLIHLGGLLVIKYSAFFAFNVNTVLSWMKTSVRMYVPHFVMPIGISFFTLQAISYLVDVYHELMPADRNFFRLALFLSFFPQIVEGPICRYNDTAPKLWNVSTIRYENLTRGIQRICYGMMKKVVVADRLNPLVQNVFDNYQTYDGGIIAFAAICYTIQLYCDFSGAMDAVLGVSQIFGVSMPENFQRPFFSRTISEFWKRWHISLGAWFKDYIFYPVTMSGPMKKMTSAARKKLGNHFGPLLAGAVALFCVWFCNGLWHGAGWNYIFFGMYHFVLILFGNAIAPAVRCVNQKLHLKSESRPYIWLQVVRTTVLVIIGELFFRASGFISGCRMFGTMVTGFTFKGFNNDTLKMLGVDVLDLAIVAITMVIVFVCSLLKEKGFGLREEISKKNVVLRWVLFYALIMYIIVFGAYGFGYVPVDPMYAEF